MRDSSRQSRYVGMVLGLPAFLWLGAFFVFPLAFIFGLSFSEKNGLINHTLTWTSDNYLVAVEPIYLTIFAKSLLIAAAATAICLLISYPVALAIAFSPARFRMPLLLAISLPFWINTLIRTYALIAVFRTRGFLNFTLESFWQFADSSLEWLGVSGGLGDAYTPLELLYTNAAVVAGIAYVFVPFMILPLYAVMERFDRSYLEASLDLGGRTLANFLVGTVATYHARYYQRRYHRFCASTGSFFYRRHARRN
jgi:spermidine/putrescine transport system permease protein